MTVMSVEAVPAGVKPGATCVPLVAASIASFAVAKLLLAVLTGYTGDEAYGVVVARTLSLSYFDHPPMHQWIAHGIAALFGEGTPVRVFFALMAIGINVPLFALTQVLYGRAAALWAVLGFNATAYFVVWPDGLILPDTPLLLFLACAVWAIAEVLFGRERSARGTTALWLIAGVMFGCAGLSKYSAALAAASLLGFLAFSPRHRHWLWQWQPYLAAALALAVFAPVLIWNTQNHFASFAFQSSRVSKGFAFDRGAWSAFAEGFGAQVALLSLWVGVPLVAAICAAARPQQTSSSSRTFASGADSFLLWLTLVPVLLFLLMPFLGKRALPHWFNSGWLFAMPMLGYWLSGKSERWLRTWMAVLMLQSAILFGVYLVHVTTGVLQPWMKSARLYDPTEWSFDWTGLKSTAAWRGVDGKLPGFVVVERWRAAGKAGVAFGHGTPVCAFNDDPRHLAFTCDQAALIGSDAVIVVPRKLSAAYLAHLAPYFKVIDAGEDVALGRHGHAEQSWVLARAHGFVKPYPLPYGLDGHAAPAKVKWTRDGEVDSIPTR